MPGAGVRFVAGALLGAVAGAAIDVRPGDALAVAIVAGVVGLVERFEVRAAATSLVVVALSCWNASIARERAFAPPLAVWFNAHAAAESFGPVRVSGVLARDAARTPAGVRLLVDVIEVGDRDARERIRGRVLAMVSGSLATTATRDWSAGRVVELSVTLRRPVELRNFGGPAPRWQSLRRPFVLQGTVKSGALVEARRGPWWTEGAAALRRHVRDAVQRHVTSPASGIIVAVLIGDRAGLDEETERRLQRAGTYHVIAISGGNVAVIAVIAALLGRMLIRSFRSASLLALVVLVLYGWTVGGDPSVARAVTAAVVFLAAHAAGIVASPMGVLRTTAVLLVTVDPLVVLDVGAWLSFGATFGIIQTFIVLRPMRWPGRAHAAQRALRLLVALTQATCGAELMLIPVLASVFGLVSLAGFALNPVAIPAMAIVQVAGLGLVVASPVWGTAAAACGHVATIAVKVLLGSASVTDVWPWLVWRVPPSPLLWIVVYYLALTSAVVAPRRLRAAAVAAGSAALFAIVSGLVVEHERPIPGRLRLTVLDVGQGECVLLQSAGGTLMIDAGGTPGSYDIGGRVVTPAAWALGVRRLNWLALSHGDRDHVGGAPAVIRDLRPREIWEGVPVPADVGRLGLRGLATESGIAWRTVRVGDVLEAGGALIEVRHPPEPDWERQRVRNEDSMVLRVRFGQVEFWLTGDAGLEFESHAPIGASRAPLRVLKVGHHGSRSSTSKGFVESLRPHVAIVSAGKGNLFGHPSPQVISRLAAAGAEVFRTDRDGAVVLETDGVAVSIATANGRRWSLSSSPRRP